MSRILRLALSAAAALILPAAGALAAGGPVGDYRDEETGLEVKIPPNFLQPPQAAAGRGVVLKRAGDEGVVCSATFAPAATDAAAPAGVKDVARRWRASAAGKGRAFVSASSFGPDRRAPPAAVAIVSDRRGDLAGFPRQRRRSLTILWETPKGVTSLACESPKVRFGILRREFEALAGGVTPPR